MALLVPLILLQSCAPAAEPPPVVAPAPPNLTPPPANLAPATPATVKVDWNETHQTVVGFGGTMSWIHPPAAKRDEIFDLIFNRLGASVLRVQALGAETGDEGSLEPVNDNDNPAVFDWSKFPIAVTEAKNAVLIQAAQARGVKTIVPAAWSPPGWMKSNNSRVGGALLEKYLDEYAECWTAYVMGMKREFNIDLKYISPQNEPDLTYTYPTCRIDDALYAKAAAKIAARLKQEKLATQVLGPDTCRIYNLESYLAALDREKVSPTLPALTHLYDLSLPFERLDKDPERWAAARKVARHYNRPLWQMECSNYISQGVEKGSFAEALTWAQHIHHALTAGDCEVVCFWSLFFDKKGEALIFCARTEAPEYEILPVFYSSLNYYRPIRPGMVRCTATISTPDLLVSAYRLPAATIAAPTSAPTTPPTAGATPQRAVIVLINPGKNAAPIRWDAAPGSRWYGLATTATRHAELAGVATPGEFTLPAESVVTLIAAPPNAPASPTLDDLCPLPRSP